MNHSFSHKLWAAQDSCPFMGMKTYVWISDMSPAQTISCEGPSWWTNLRDLNYSSFYPACILLTNKTFYLSDDDDDDDDQAASTHSGKESVYIGT